MAPVADLTEPELQAWGEAFGRGLGAPMWVCLSGDLGAGKTTLAAAILRGLGVRDRVTSPTFAVVHAYETAKGQPVHHADLYRLSGPSQLPAIGWDELLGSAGVVLVEWPERAGDGIPPEARRIVLEHLASDPARRRVRW